MLHSVIAKFRMKEFLTESLYRNRTLSRSVPLRMTCAPPHTFSQRIYVIQKNGLGGRRKSGAIRKTFTHYLYSINKLNNGKASRPSDKILNEYIKSTKDILLPIYTKLFNHILDSGKIPEKWLSGYIIPIFKIKDNSLYPGSYRPVTILSCLGKLFSAVLNVRLTKYIEHKKVRWGIY